MDINTPQALTNVRVLDLTGPAGFYCTKLLADLGADVVKIESLGSHHGQKIGPFFGDGEDPNLSLYRWHFHTNKRSMLLDIKKSEDRRLLNSLLHKADVLVDTLNPIEAQSLGLSAQRIRKDYPSLIHTMITGFGHQGPYRDYKVTDIVCMAMGGLMTITGFPEDPPNQLGAEQAYHMGSLHAAVGTMLALLSRDLHGNGHDVQISMQDSVSMATLQTANFNFYTWHEIIRSRTGLNHAFSNQQPSFEKRHMPHTLYACKDGWVAYAAHTGPPNAWARFVAWLSSYSAECELADPRFEDPEVRQLEQPRINEIMTAHCAQHSSQRLYHSAQAFRLLCTPVQTVADLLADEHLNHRGYFVEVEHPELSKTFTYPGAPYKLSETPWKLKRRAPMIGEDTEKVLHDWLDLSPEEISELYEHTR